MVPMDEDVWAVVCEGWRQAGGFVGEAKPNGLSEVIDKDDQLMIEIREGHPECGTCRILGTAAEHQATGAQNCGFSMPPKDEKEPILLYYVDSQSVQFLLLPNLLFQQ